MPKYSLYREDGMGDSGPMSEILDPAEGYMPIPGEDYPRVGCGVRVGSISARTFQHQDWWQTSPILEILEETINDEGFRSVKFKTRSSIYTWKEF